MQFAIIGWWPLALQWLSWPQIQAQDASLPNQGMGHVRVNFTSNMRRSAPAVQFLPAKPQLFWALTEIPSITQAKQLPEPLSASQSRIGSSQRDGFRCESPTKKATKPARRPLIGRPASAPQLQRSKAQAPVQRPKPRTPSPTRGRRSQHPHREACREASREASAMTVPIVVSCDQRKENEQQTSAGESKRQAEDSHSQDGTQDGRSQSKLGQQHHKSKAMAWQENISEKTVQQLGYQPGLPRKPAAQSLIPKHVSDLPNVLARMERLKAEQLELTQSSPCEAVKIKTRKDVCVLEFPENGSRLLVNRWRPGYSERQQPSRAQSAPGRRARSSPHLSPSTGFPCAQVQPVKSFQSAQKGSQGVSVLNFELIGKAE